MPNKRTIILYHWSPRSRRESILKQGLCPNKLSKDKEWRPPYICFSASPSLSWGLSGSMSDIYGEWDLWMVYSSSLTKYKTSNNGNREYRVYERIPKRKVWYVGSRIRNPRKSRKK